MRLEVNGQSLPEGTAFEFTRELGQFSRGTIEPGAALPGDYVHVFDRDVEVAGFIVEPKLRGELMIGGKEAEWDPHAVDADHPCAACGKTASHVHEAGTIERALVLDELRDPETGLLQVPDSATTYWVPTHDNALWQDGQPSAICRMCGMGPAHHGPDLNEPCP